MQHFSIFLQIFGYFVATKKSRELVPAFSFLLVAFEIFVQRFSLALVALGFCLCLCLRLFSDLVYALGLQFAQLVISGPFSPSLGGKGPFPSPALGPLGLGRPCLGR